MQASRSYVFEFVRVDASPMLQRELTQMDLDALSPVGGDLDTFGLSG